MWTQICWDLLYRTIWLYGLDLLGYSLQLYGDVGGAAIWAQVWRGIPSLYEWRRFVWEICLKTAESARKHRVGCHNVPDRLYCLFLDSQAGTPLV